MDAIKKVAVGYAHFNNPLWEELAKENQRIVIKVTMGDEKISGRLYFENRTQNTKPDF
jgi:hypothetical protein